MDNIKLYIDGFSSNVIVLLRSVTIIRLDALVLLGYSGNINEFISVIDNLCINRIALYFLYLYYGGMLVRF